MDVTRRFLMLCALVLGVQAFVGVTGFTLHLRAVFRESGSTLFERLLAGPPPMAPLLLPNLVILGLIGLWILGRRLPSDIASGTRVRASQASDATYLD
jgi:hypothetical protein